MTSDALLGMPSGALSKPSGDASANDSPSTLGHPMRVLVVDDNVDAAESMAMLLQAEGYQVFVEHDGATALACVQRESPKVCLLDIGLPDMDGFELARRIRAQPAMAQAVLIALTGYGRDEDRQRSLDAGFNLHRVKPVDPDELSALVMWSPDPPKGNPVTRG